MTKYHLIIVFKSFDKPLHLYPSSRHDSLSSYDQMKGVFGAAKEIESLENCIGAMDAIS